MARVGMLRYFSEEGVGRMKYTPHLDGTVEFLVMDGWRCYGCFHENKTQSIWMDPGRILHDSSLQIRIIYI